MSKFCNLIKTVLTEDIPSDTGAKIRQYIDELNTRRQNEKIIEDNCKETLIPEICNQLNCENLEKIVPTAFLDDDKLLILKFTFKYLHPISPDGNENLGAFKKEKIEEAKSVVKQAADYIQNVKKMSVKRVFEISGLMRSGSTHNMMNQMWNTFHPQQQGHFQDTENDECYIFGGMSIQLTDDEIEQYTK